MTDKKTFMKELKQLLQEGWSEHEKKADWNSYLEQEVKAFYPLVYDVLKGNDVKKLDKKVKS